MSPFDELEPALKFAVERGAISNDEFALARLASDDWWAEAGNPAPAVCLGESSGEIHASGKTHEEAVVNLILKLIGANS